MGLNMGFSRRGSVKRFIVLAARYRIPAIYEWRAFADRRRCLISYSMDRNEVGADPGSLCAAHSEGGEASRPPRRQSSRFEFVIKLKTATSLELIIPPTLLARADEVIE